MSAVAFPETKWEKGNGKWDGNGKSEVFPISSDRTAIPRRSLAFVPRALGENTVFGPSYPGDYAFEEIAAEQVWNWQQNGLTPAECLTAMGWGAVLPDHANWRAVRVAVAHEARRMRGGFGA